MKKLILATLGLALSLAANSQTLESTVSMFNMSLSPVGSLTSPISLANPWRAFTPSFTTTGLIYKTVRQTTMEPFQLIGEPVNQRPTVDLRSAYVIDKSNYSEKKAVFQQKVKLIGGLTFSGSLEVLACDDELFRSPETANFSIRIH